MNKDKFGKLFGLISFLVLISMFSCKKGNTYADHVEAEDDAIDEYVEKNNISIVGKMPEGDSEWMDGDQKVYYLYGSGRADGLYYHQVSLGDGDVKPQENWTAYVRYQGYTLSGELVYDCTASVSPDPLSFIVLSNATGASYGVGFQQAVKNLRVGGHCQVIIPFKLANNNLVTISGTKRSDASNYQPMFYDIWLVALE